MPELVLLGGPSADDQSSATSASHVILIHGFGSDTQSWVGTAPALFSLGQVWALDLPGHGKSWAEKPADTIETLVDQIESTVFSATEQPVHLVGHSIGGTLAMMLAHRQPGRVASLVLLAPAGLGCGVDDTFIKRYPKLSTEDETLKQLRTLVCNDRLIPDIFAQLVLSQLKRDGVRQALTTFGDLVLSNSEVLKLAASALVGTELPRLIFWGEQDLINPLNKDDEECFGGVWQVLDNCGHLPHIEHRLSVNEAVAEFLTELAD